MFGTLTARIGPGPAGERLIWTGASVASSVAMYAVISAGATQRKVAEGEQVNVDLLDAADGAEVSLRPLLLVDGDTVLATPDELAGVTVTAKVIGAAKGPKINGFTYKRRTNQRRRYGHRQKYTLVEITKIAK